MFEVVDPKLSVSFISLLFLFDGEALQLRSYCTAGSILNLLAAQLPEFTLARKLMFAVGAFFVIYNPCLTFMPQKLQHCDSACSQVHLAICTSSIFSTLKRVFLSFFFFQTPMGKFVFMCTGVRLCVITCACFGEILTKVAACWAR